MLIRPLSVLSVTMLATACNLPAPEDAVQRPDKEFSVPVPESFSLANGMAVWLLPSKHIPLVNLSIVLRMGSAQDPRGKEGLATMVADMLDEGSGNFSALEVAAAVDQLGADLAVDVQKEHFEVSLEVLKRNLDAALDIFADIVLRPRFDPSEWDRVHEMALNDIAQRREEARDVARVVSERVFYGDGHAFGHPVDGYESSVKSITLDDVKSFHATWARPERAVLLVIGDITADELRPRLESRFGAWAGAGESPRAVTSAPPSAPTSARLVVVDKPGAPQTEVRIVLPGPAFGAPGVPPLSLANTILGGTFTSRLMTNLRERNGFTYGASSQTVTRSGAGHVVLGSAIATPKTGPALVEFWRELQAMESSKFEPGELQKSRSTHRSRFVEALESQASTMKLYLPSAALQGGPGERREFLARLAQASNADIIEASRSTYRWDAATIVLVGDAEVITAQLAELAKSPPTGQDGKPMLLPQVERRGRDGEI